MFHNYLHHQGNRRIYKKPNCLYSLPQMSAVRWQRFLEEWEQKSSNTKKPKTSLYRNINQKMPQPKFYSTERQTGFRIDSKQICIIDITSSSNMYWYFFHIKTLWRTSSFLIIILLRYEHSYNSIFQFTCTCRAGLMSQSINTGTNKLHMGQPGYSAEQPIGSQTQIQRVEIHCPWDVNKEQTQHRMELGLRMCHVNPPTDNSGNCSWNGRRLSSPLPR